MPRSSVTRRAAAPVPRRDRGSGGSRPRPAGRGGKASGSFLPRPKGRFRRFAVLADGGIVLEDQRLSAPKMACNRLRLRASRRDMAPRSARKARVRPPSGPAPRSCTAGRAGDTRGRKDHCPGEAGCGSAPAPARRRAVMGQAPAGIEGLVPDMGRWLQDARSQLRRDGMDRDGPVQSPRRTGREQRHPGVACRGRSGRGGRWLFRDGS